MLLDPEAKHHWRARGSPRQRPAIAGRAAGTPDGFFLSLHVTFPVGCL